MGSCSSGSSTTGNFTNATQNKFKKWDRFSTRRIKCKGAQDIKYLKVFDICNNNASGNNCTYNNTRNYNGTGIYEKWIVGKMEVNLNSGKKKSFYISRLINEKKLSNIAGVTLIEILIGILISVIMMGAMFTSYTVVNNTYSQVTDRAKISTAGRDVVGMIMRDVRNAGFKYFGDNIKTTNAHAPILITKSSNFNTSCDKIDIVFGGVNYNATRNPKYQYERFKVTYECKASTIPDKTSPKLSGGGYPPIKAFAIYKTKVKWNNTSNS